MQHKLIWTKISSQFSKILNVFGALCMLTVLKFQHNSPSFIEAKLEDLDPFIRLFHY